MNWLRRKRPMTELAALESINARLWTTDVRRSMTELQRLHTEVRKLLPKGIPPIEDPFFFDGYLTGYMDAKREFNHKMDEHYRLQHPEERSRMMQEARRA